MKNLRSKGLILAMHLALLPLVSTPAHAVENAEAVYEEVEKGPNNGRMLRQGNFAIELAIYEDGVPPEFRVWASQSGQMISPDKVKVDVVLDRLGDVKDNIGFYQQEDYLRGDMAIYEPHSFAVKLNAEFQGKEYTWAYDNFEGRVVINDDIAKASGIKTEKAGPANIRKTISAYGQLISPIENTRTISARFDGLVRKVHVNLGDDVKKGMPLLTVESDKSLNSYTIYAPISGVVTNRNINTGEQTNGKELLRIVDKKSLAAELFVFPENRSKIQLGNPVSLVIEGVAAPIEGQIDYISPEMDGLEGVAIRVSIKNQSESLSPGAMVKGTVTTNIHEVPLSVKRDGIQAFRDFQVVYAKVGNTYEVRMLELGEQAGEWAEVRGGLEPGTEYVTSSSYVIKADIDKSGASHDH